MSITYAMVESPLGLLLLAATDRGVCFVEFGDSQELLLEELRKEYPEAKLEAMGTQPSSQFEEWIAALNGYLAAEQPSLDLPLDVRATAFQMRVWNYLAQIPAGEVRSYASVAAAIGNPSATRAVARACATNPVALAIPCHRVIRSSGELGGYRWGMERKRALLEHEKRARAATPAV
jgi:AraC family transcriptional regulator of adaptative response/methylated-DNA-[protein]-cysteine methyltransferase